MSPIKRIIIDLLLICFLLSGCNGSWLDGSYNSATPHKEHSGKIDPNNMSAFDYTGLLDALGQMVYQGEERGIISIQKYNQNHVISDMEDAIRYTLDEDPFGAYAVEQIHYELGTNAAKPAIAVTIQFRRSQEDISKVKTASYQGAILDFVASALKNCATELVIYVTEYNAIDFVQMVDDYAAEHPDVVMELPEIITNTYPAYGDERILEIKFNYQNSRDSLKNMQNLVSRVFESASLYVTGDSDDRQKYSQLYSFLMERFEYQVQTSITPAYSLLNHGVGDSEAFATVYAAMCRSAGLECQTVLGTVNGEVRYWNIIRSDDNYAHVDLLYSNQQGSFKELSDSKMKNRGYVWDFSAYPECDGPYVPEPPPTRPTEPTIPTEPSEPVEPTNPTDPTEPIDPTDPTDPTEPVDPTDPTDPTEPVDPTDPTAPTEPVDPTDPTDPTEPSEPVDPTAPTLPSEPTEPMDPTDHPVVTEPSEPAEATEPTEPTGIVPFLLRLFGL